MILGYREGYDDSSSDKHTRPSKQTDVKTEQWWKRYNRYSLDTGVENFLADVVRDSRGRQERGEGG